MPADGVLAVCVCVPLQASMKEARDVLCMSEWKVEKAIERCTPSHPTTSGMVPGSTPPAPPTHRASSSVETSGTDSGAQVSCPHHNLPTCVPTTSSNFSSEQESEKQHHL